MMIIGDLVYGIHICVHQCLMWLMKKKVYYFLELKWRMVSKKKKKKFEVKNKWKILVDF